MLGPVRVALIVGTIRRHSHPKWISGCSSSSFLGLGRLQRVKLGAFLRAVIARTVVHVRVANARCAAAGVAIAWCGDGIVTKYETDRAVPHDRLALQLTPCVL